MESSMYYPNYLALDKILNSQFPESGKEGKKEAHDEMLFIIIHQAYELWFKQILFEIDSVAAIMNKPSVNDNSPEVQTIVHRLQRVVTILKVLVHQIDIMETMTPMDFLDFRDMLRPASGFQSWQFKILEAKLGLRYEHRHGQDYYTSHLNKVHVDKIKEVEKEKTLLTLINSWLERMPFFEEELWEHYQTVYKRSLAEAEKENAAFFEEVFITRLPDDTRQLSPKACRNALFIMAYRGYPMLELPYQLLNTLMEIDEQLGTWRYRHFNMVQRMIGTRIGTGGSSGAGYLKSAMDKHYIFKEIAQLTSFLIERRNLPKLPVQIKQKLGFTS
ncbi:MAG TPA: tryptophan 2,3-dioxygenase family protein [Chitinophagaceae bacterium]|nr:tryptophan 2,3-dioxygenase family protein [Chitinophagaceae bacterium]